MESFTDSNVNNYIETLSLQDLKSLVDELKKDFDNAISSRFTVSSSQSSTLVATPSFFKDTIITAFDNLYTIRSNNATCDFTITGLNQAGSGSGLQNAKISIEIGHRSDCTWYIKVTIEK